MFDKFEGLVSWKLSWGLSFLLFGFSDGHIFFDFFKLLPKCVSKNGRGIHPCFQFWDVFFAIVHFANFATLLLTKYIYEIFSLWSCLPFCDYFIVVERFTV